MFRYYGLLGLSLVIASFFLRITGTNVGGTETFVIGFWLFFDALDFKMSGTSILHKIKKKNSIILYMIFIGTVIGLIFDFFGAIISNLWTYPTFNIVYPINIISAYGLPFVMYYSAYRVFSVIIRREFREFGTKLVSKKTESRFFGFVVYIGLVCILIPVLLIPFLDSISSMLRGLLFAFTMLGMWFILEGIEYRQHKRSLLKDILEGYWNPIAALVIAAFITGFSWELLNTIDWSWKYHNLPFSTNIFGVPVGVIIGWIPLFVIYLSFYGVMFKSKDSVF